MIDSEILSESQLKAKLVIRHKQVIVNSDFRRLEEYTFPRITYEQLIAKGYKRIIVSSVSEADKLTAICISVSNTKNKVQIISFYTDPAYRLKGVAKHLLQSVLSKVEASKFSAVYLYYKTFWKDVDAWESVLKSNQCLLSETGNEYVKIKNLLDLKTTDLMRMKLPSDACEIVHLDNRRINQIEGWLSLTGNNTVPQDVRPGKHKSRISTECSLMLLVDGNIAGWIISDQISDHTIQVGSLFVLPKYSRRYMYLGKCLIAELIRGNTQPYEVYFGIRESNFYMKRFITRELGVKALRYEQKRAEISF